MLRDYAEHRSALHKHHKTRRALSKDYDLVGLAGEEAFAAEFGLQVDLADRPGGDAGRDFYLRTYAGRFRVDIKTGRRADRMLVEARILKPQTIYVMATYSDLVEAAHCVGWLWGSAVRRLSPPPRDTGRGIVNYVIQREQVRGLDELKLACVGPG